MPTNLLATTYDELVNDILNTIDVSSADGFTFNYEIDLAFTTATADMNLPAITVDPASTLAIVGESGGTTLNGAGTVQLSGFRVAAGQVSLTNLNVEGFVAVGSYANGLGYGGHAGLGGGLYVSTGASVTLNSVSFSRNAAYGEAGSPGGRPAIPPTVPGYGGAAGSAGALSGRSGSNGYSVFGGGGGGGGGTGGAYRALSHQGYAGGNGTAGLPTGPSGFGYGGFRGGGGGGGGGGADGTYGPITARKQPIGGTGGDGGDGGNGGFGGGGGGGGAAGGGGGGLGGGGAGGTSGGAGGAGGFGAGNGGQGGGGYDGGTGAGAIGGASGIIGGGGGGLGAGGNIFVRQGGTLLFASGYTANGIVEGGLGGKAAHILGATDGLPGQALGTGIFIQGNQTITLDPAPGATTTIDDSIADQAGDGGRGAVFATGGGTVALNATNSFTGGLTIDNADVIGNFTLDDGTSYGPAPVTFAGPGTLDTISFQMANTIEGFATGDVLAGTFQGGADDVAVSAASANIQGGIVTIELQGFVGSLTYSLRVAGIADGTPIFTSLTDIPTTGEIDTTVGLSLACFAAGTNILTTSGEIPVEALRPGDTVATLNGQTLHRVIWTGSRTIDLARHPTPDRVAPVLIRAHAFAPGIPHRDLRLSPDHAIYIDGALVPAARLVNNATILREHPAAITYHHIELAKHDVLLAEGLPCEAYLDTGNRAAFAGAPATTLHPDFAHRRREASACARLLTHGPALEAIRTRLNPDRRGSVSASVTTQKAVLL